MANINLGVKVTLDIKDEDKIVKSFEVVYREASKKQQKKLGKENKEVLDLFKKNQNLDRRVKVLEDKQEVLKALGEDKALLGVIKELEKLYNAKDEVEDEFETLGGFDKLSEASEETFKIAVTGKDSKELIAFIEENGDYSDYLEAIVKDVEDKKGN